MIKTFCTWIFNKWLEANTNYQESLFLGDVAIGLCYSFICIFVTCKFLKNIKNLNLKIMWKLKIHKRQKLASHPYIFLYFKKMHLTLKCIWKLMVDTGSEAYIWNFFFQIVNFPSSYFPRPIGQVILTWISFLKS